MRRILYSFILCLCACAYSLPALSWGQEGHRIIAQIAYDNLTRKARKQVDKVLGDHGMIYWANWPDEIKSDTIYPRSIKEGWHYQDFEGGLRDSVVVAAMTDYRKEGGNLFRALDSLVTLLKDSKTVSQKGRSADSLAHTLRFVIHISGDKYCPMHMAHMDDKGGNAVKMKWFSKHTNLHSVWDSKLIESQGYSYTEYAAKLERDYAHRKRAIMAMSEEELLLNTYHLTEAIYAYQQTFDENTYHYIYRWHTPMEEQLYIAGIRLAKLLNGLF